MDKELKAKWVEALRSGAYRQARGALSDGHGYCCLGVLCKVAGLKITGGNGILDENLNDVGYMPVIRLLGDFSYYNLSERNDGNEQYHKHSFAEIADYIEREL